MTVDEYRPGGFDGEADADPIGEPMHITDYLGNPLLRLVCCACEGTAFEVGWSEHYTTGIRCVSCGWESTWHVG